MPKYFPQYLAHTAYSVNGFVSSFISFSQDAFQGLHDLNFTERRPLKKETW